MFRKLHRRLTLICAVGTGVVLLAMLLVALAFSLSRLRLQQEQAFQSDLNTVFYYLQAQPAVDHAWLSRTEAAGGLIIGIRIRDRGLRYRQTDEARAALIAQAEATARDQHGYSDLQRPDGASPLVIEYALRAENRDYRGATASVPYQDSWFTVTVLKDRSPEQALIRQLRIIYVAITCAAIAALALFAHFFTGRAIRPVKESYRKQREFVSAASHELRSPLAVLRMGIGMLRSGTAPDPGLTDKLDAECARLSRLVGDLLLLARADDGRWSLQMGEASPQTLLLDAYERFEGLVRERGVALRLESGNPLPAVIPCDGERIAQVLAILLDNALEYTPEGGEILLGAARGERGDRNVLFSVDDSGPGIREEDQAHLFDRFFRADPSRASEDHHGLGLSIAKEIVSLHGGSIAVYRSALGGARFTVSLKTAAEK